MKIKKVFAGMAAAVMAVSMMAVSASATNLFDVVDPESDDYYSIGAMAFYMSQEWKWNQSDWIGITEDGTLEIEYEINEILTDTTMEGKGTLGDMGVMVLNLPEDNYPYDVVISDATFTPKGGDPITLDSVNAITSAERDKESGFRIHIRPTAEVDDDGNETLAATPEVAGMEEEGAFKGGTLKMTINFKDAVAASSDTETTGVNETAPAEDAEPTDDAQPAESTDEEKPDQPAKTGAAANGAVLLIGAAAAALAVTKKRH